MATTDEPAKRLLTALTDIEAAAQGNIDRSRQLQRRARKLRQRLEAGGSVVDLVKAEPAPRMVELVSTNMATLETAAPSSELLNPY